VTGRLASEYGYEGTQVSDIVALAGVSKRSFYEHFSTKDNCFAQLMCRAFVDTIRQLIRLAEELEGNRPSQVILALLELQTDITHRNAKLAGMFEDFAKGSPTLVSEHRANLDRISEFYAAAARRLGSPLPDRRLNMTARILCQGLPACVDEHGDLPHELLPLIADVWCHALSIADGVRPLLHDEMTNRSDVRRTEMAQPSRPRGEADALT
jgi:AcrR family transcriptional regulator